MTVPSPTVLLDPERAGVLLWAATLAPSLHNSQPWAFAFGPRHVEVYADASRQLRNADPSGRSLLISCGASVFNLRVAAGQLGFHVQLRLLPEPIEPTLVAVAELDERQQPGGDLHGYFAALPARRTNRHPFQARPIPHAVRTALIDAARAEGGVLHVFDDPDEVARIIDLLHDADIVDRTDPARLAERQKWVRDQSRGGGIPPASLGSTPTQQHTPFRDLDQPGVTRDYATFETAPTLAVLSTSADRPVDWVRAGQALERLLLEATKAGISASFLNQPLEQEDLRWLVRDPLTGVGHSHMILRLGYGNEVPASPRRPVKEVRRAPKW